ncbi:hypothetical protein GCWU000341_02278 [Oribacterium sp. oral taxon 078 str. F0262]|uniref:DUF2634 domain-containing protein n=1 Tax=Oribacterium sp. oral taxon 078 TaxID=652706 RepID=UPI0001CDEDFB|nr:DUF2634 domain-containing protein [Oribacterium sp. oral taxon 078]EFE91170.1 hypothetical protein GCWU000341_02278 [Oribacterium sp. oral taxon 078 str. F0262]
MIPITSGLLDRDFSIEERPSLTHWMDIERKSIQGMTDAQDAMRQAIYKILNTERYEYEIYSWDYGIETLDLYGEPVTWVVPELERRVREALLQDTRITEISDFEFDFPEKRVVHVVFTVHTIFGELKAERTVRI